MQEESFEGIVLRSTDYRDNGRIITLFTKESGVISVVVSRLKSGDRMALSLPFCQAEFVCIRGRGDLFRLHDGATIDHHHDLRSTLTILRAAGEIAQTILRSQLPGKPAPKLYTLLISCLRQLPLFPSPVSLLTAFRLKAWQLEGSLSWEHRDHLPFSVDDDEWKTLAMLAACRSFEKIKKSVVTPTLSSRVANAFYECHAR